MRSKNVKILTYSIILLSISLILGYIEAIFPINIGGIGIKIGLSNIISIIGIKTIGIKKTLIINVLRLIILGVFFGNIVRFTISVFGFVFSYFTMAFLLTKLNFSIIISSIFGGVFHYLGQFIALIIIMKSTKILSLLAIYAFIGILTGFIVGEISYIVLKRLKYL